MVGLRESEPGELERPPRAAQLLSPPAHLPYAAQPQPRSLLGQLHSPGLRLPWGSLDRSPGEQPSGAQPLVLWFHSPELLSGRGAGAARAGGELSLPGWVPCTLARPTPC